MQWGKNQKESLNAVTLYLIPKAITIARNWIYLRERA